MKKKKSYLLLYVIIGVFLIGIGYAEIGNIDLNIEGEASMDRQTGAVITSVNYVDSVLADESLSKINSFYQTLFNSYLLSNYCIKIRFMIPLFTTILILVLLFLESILIRY